MVNVRESMSYIDKCVVSGDHPLHVTDLCVGLCMGVTVWVSVGQGNGLSYYCTYYTIIPCHTGGVHVTGT